jgi:putative ABC transport system permease protein
VLSNKINYLFGGKFFMYILQNAGKNIGRNKGRNILMGIIILAIIATSAVALIINNTAAGIIDNYKARFGSEVSITPNMEKVMQEAQRNSSGGTQRMMLFQRPEIPPEQYIAFGDSDYIKEARYSSSVGVHKTDDLNVIDEDKGGGSSMFSGRAVFVGRPAGDTVSSAETDDAGEDESLFYANLLGYNYTPEDFTEGMRQLAEGRFPEADGECVISRDLLENSNLKIGDTMTLESTLREQGAYVMPGEEDDSETVRISFNLEIVGYYDDLTEEYNEFARDNDFLQNAYMNRRNEILTTVNTVISQMQDGFTGINVDAKYYLNNPADLDNFAAELYAKGLDDKCDVTTDEASYNAIVKPVEGLKKITYVFLIVVLLLGAIILILLSTIAIRERKYEIGVLRAMGMKKSKVAFGLLSEVVMITVVCLILGLGAGIVVAQPVSDMLLENQLQQIEDQSGNNNLMVYGSGRNVTRSAGTANAVRIGAPGMMGQTPAEALKEMDVSLDIVTVGEIILVSLILAVIASSAGIMHVTKYEPIKILSDRT